MVRHPSLSFWLNLVIYLVITLIGMAVHFTQESFHNERQKRQLMENQFTTELMFLKNQIKSLVLSTKTKGVVVKLPISKAIYDLQCGMKWAVVAVKCTLIFQ